MHTKITLFFMLFSCVLFAQYGPDELIRYELDHQSVWEQPLIKKNAIQYSYNTLGQKIREVEYFWNDDLQLLSLNQEKIFDYQEDALIEVKWKRFDPEGNLTLDESKIYQYDNNCHLISDEKIFQDGKAVQRKTYEYQDCELVAMINWKGALGNWEPRLRTTYAQNGAIQNIKLFNRDGDRWELLEEMNIQKDTNGNLIRKEKLGNITSTLELYEYNEKNQLIKAIVFNGSFGNLVANKASETIYEYDEQGTLSYSSIFGMAFGEDDLKLAEERIIKNLYDDNDKLVEQKINLHRYYDPVSEMWDYVEIIDIAYSYYCNGLLAEKKADGSKRNYTIIERFFPLENIPCEEELGEPLPIVLFPNPAETYLNVEHELLRYHECKVELLDASGKLMSQINYNYNVAAANFDISFLPQGVYFLKLTKEDQQYVSKFVKL